MLAVLSKQQQLLLFLLLLGCRVAKPATTSKGSTHRHMTMSLTTENVSMIVNQTYQRIPSTLVHTLSAATAATAAQQRTRLQAHTHTVWVDNTNTFHEAFCIYGDCVSSLPATYPLSRLLQGEPHLAQPSVQHNFMPTADQLACWRKLPHIAEQL